MSRRGTRGIAAVILAMTTVANGTVSASAATPSTVQPQTAWHRYHQADFTVPAGEACAFEAAGKVLFDREYFRNLSRYSNGNVRVVLFRGPLIVQDTNVAKGTKVIRDQSGVAKERFNRDGSFASIKVISGYFGATLPPGSDPRRGEYYVGGQGATLFQNTDGTRTLKLGSTVPRRTSARFSPGRHRDLMASTR